MTSLNGYIQGLGSGADRIVRKTGTTVKLSVYDDIDTVIVFNEAGETSQTGTPTPSDPVDIVGIGVRQLDDTYSVTINYDDGDGRTGSVIASGLAYPLYEGDILDFVNSKVIRRNNYYSYSSAQYYGTFGSDNAPLYYVLITDYNTKPIKNMQNSTFIGRLYSNMLIKITAASTPNMNNNEIRTEGAATPSRFYFRADQFTDLTDLNNHLSNNNLIVAAELQNTIDEPITITGDISDIGTATVTADGTLTVKYDKVEMAIRKYS